MGWLERSDAPVRPHEVSRARSMIEDGSWFRVDALAAAIIQVTAGAISVREWVEGAPRRP
jgi:hypothetical protein